MSRKPAGGGQGHAHKHAGNPPRKHQHHGSKKHHPGRHKQPQQWGSGPPIVVTSHSHQHRKPHKARGWTPGSDVACCTAEAAGVLLGLSDADVLALYDATPRDPDGYANILDTLEAFDQFQPASCSRVHLGRPAWIGDDGDFSTRPRGLNLSSRKRGLSNYALPPPHQLMSWPATSL